MGVWWCWWLVWGWGGKRNRYTYIWTPHTGTDTDTDTYTSTKTNSTHPVIPRPGLHPWGGATRGAEQKGLGDHDGGELVGGQPGHEGHVLMDRLGGGGVWCVCRGVGGEGDCHVYSL